ncbi:uncharacterized protein LOC112347998 [Selaginella moellendorffii]|nr:uncharacterized protein LOC112347998 [Selaginella moellendorffii]|eukprot:XP_024535595.1 uncharacterized protein LOC112347998 [Selaginella moellendorffii]
MSATIDKESPFGARLRRYHENPLFKSSPADNPPAIIGDLDLSFKENATVDSGGKFKVWNSTTKTSSKRILGESNCYQEQDWCAVEEEPPKAIRALSFSSERNSADSSDESLSSLSTSPPSPTSRFTLSPPMSPNGSESSSGSVEGGHRYDPKVNLRTPRPKFLRYRPDWRLEFLSSLELKEGETLESAIESLNSREQNAAGDASVLSADNEEEDCLSNEKRSFHVDDVATEVLSSTEQQQSLSDHFQDGKLGDDQSPRAIEGKEDGEMAATKQEEAPLFCTTLRAASFMLLLGSFVAIGITLMIADTDIASESSVSTLRQKFTWTKHLEDTVTRDFADFDDWEWSPDYDVSESFRNQSTGLSLFSTDSLELDALLMAIMYGSERDVQQRYLELMEHEDVEFYHDVGSILAGGSLEFTKAEEEAEKEPSGVQGEQSSDDDVDVRDHTEVHSGESLSSVGDELPELENVDDLQMYFPRLLAKGELLPRSTTPASQLSLVVAIVLVVAHVFFRVYCHRSRTGSISRTQPLLARSPRPTAATPPTKALIDDILPSEKGSSAYGSFTAYKRIVVNEGSNKELVTLTPVRRSSRIRDQRSLKSRSPCLVRRILLSPA